MNRCANTSDAWSKSELASGVAKANLAVDPVCGMDVEADSAAHSARHGGREYHFCCVDCRTAFEADPERYATALEHA